MKIKLTDIPPEGLAAEFELPGVKPGHLGAQVNKVLTAPWARLRLEQKGDIVLASGEYRAKVGLVCSRCLEEAEFDLAAGVEWVFVPQPEAGDEEHHLSREEMEVNFIQDEAVDLGLALINEVSLALPMAPLCREDCAGLCPSCGRPKSQGCDCKAPEGDPRWAKLAQLKEDAS